MTAYGSPVTKEGDLLVVSQRVSDKAKNIDDCLEKLREMLAAVATAPRKRSATRPTRGTKERRLKDKRASSARKQFRGKPGRDFFKVQRLPLRFQLSPFRTPFR